MGTHLPAFGFQGPPTVCSIGGHRGCPPYRIKGGNQPVGRAHTCARRTDYRVCPPTDAKEGIVDALPPKKRRESTCRAGTHLCPPHSLSGVPTACYIGGHRWMPSLPKKRRESTCRAGTHLCPPHSLSGVPTACYIGGHRWMPSLPEKRHDYTGGVGGNAYSCRLGTHKCPPPAISEGIGGCPLYPEKRHDYTGGVGRNIFSCGVGTHKCPPPAASEGIGGCPPYKRKDSIAEDRHRNTNYLNQPTRPHTTHAAARKTITPALSVSIADSRR